MKEEDENILQHISEDAPEFLGANFDHFGFARIRRPRCFESWRPGGAANPLAGLTDHRARTA